MFSESIEEIKNRKKQMRIVRLNNHYKFPVIQVDPVVDEGGQNPNTLFYNCRTQSWVYKTFFKILVAIFIKHNFFLSLCSETPCVWVQSKASKTKLVHEHYSRILHSNPSMESYSSLPLDYLP